MDIFIVGSPSTRVTATLCGVPAVPPDGALDSAGRLRVLETMAALASSERTLVVTDFDLTTPETGRLFGFADYNHQIAIVSTKHLGSDENALDRRLSNLIAHEFGHLDGLRHCSHAGCVMRQAATVAEIDSRSKVPCGRCPKHFKWPRYTRYLAAVFTLALAVVGLQASLRLALPQFDAPYS